MNVGTWLAEATERMSQCGIEQPRVEAEQLLMGVLQLNRMDLIHLRGLSDAKQWLDDRKGDWQMKLQQALERRLDHEPLQYIVGCQSFYGYPIKVTPDVLIPRGDTEILVEKGLELIKGIKSPVILDVCSGSGCIPIAFAKERPDATVYGTDISLAALAVARENANINEVPVTFFEGDLLMPLMHSGLKFNLIASNPPYIPTEVVQGLMPEVKDHEPNLALDGGEDGLDFYRRLATQCKEFLLSGGYLIWEIGHDQQQACEQILLAEGYNDIVGYKDYQGYDRVVVAQMR